MPHRPIARWGRAIVVSPGSRASATISRSSTPTTEQSAGTESPMADAAWSTPIAIWSLKQNTAVGRSADGRSRSRRPAARPPWASDVPCSRSVAASPASASAAWNPAFRPRVAAVRHRSRRPSRSAGGPPRPGARRPSPRFPARRGRPPARASRRPAPRRRRPSGSRRASEAGPPPGATCGRAGCRRRGDRRVRGVAAPRARHRPRRRRPSARRPAPLPHPAPLARCGPRTASWRCGPSRVPDHAGALQPQAAREAVGRVAERCRRADDAFPRLGAHRASAAQRVRDRRRQRRPRGPPPPGCSGAAPPRHPLAGPHPPPIPWQSSLRAGDSAIMPVRHENDLSPPAGRRAYESSHDSVPRGADHRRCPSPSTPRRGVRGPARRGLRRRGHRPHRPVPLRRRRWRSGRRFVGIVAASRCWSSASARARSGYWRSRNLPGQDWRYGSSRGSSVDVGTVSAVDAIIGFILTLVVFVVLQPASRALSSTWTSTGAVAVASGLAGFRIYLCVVDHGPEARDAAHRVHGLPTLASMATAQDPNGGSTTSASSAPPSTSRARCSTSRSSSLARSSRRRALRRSRPDHPRAAGVLERASAPRVVSVVFIVMGVLLAASAWCR